MKKVIKEKGQHPEPVLNFDETISFSTISGLKNLLEGVVLGSNLLQTRGALFKH